MARSVEYEEYVMSLKLGLDVLGVIFLYRSQQKHFLSVCMCVCMLYYDLYGSPIGKWQKAFNIFSKDVPIGYFAEQIFSIALLQNISEKNIINFIGWLSYSFEVQKYFYNRIISTKNI